MGFAVAMSHDHSTTVRHFTRVQLMLKVTRRFFLLMLLGMICVNWLMPLDYVRVPGTLQVCFRMFGLLMFVCSALACAIWRCH